MANRKKHKVFCRMMSAGILSDLYKPVQRKPTKYCRLEFSTNGGKFVGKVKADLKIVEEPDVCIWTVAAMW